MHIGEVLTEEVLRTWIGEVRDSRSAGHRLFLVELLVAYLHTGQVTTRTLIPECEWVRAERYASGGRETKKAKKYYQIRCNVSKDHPLVRQFIQHLFDVNEHWQKAAKYTYRHLCRWLSEHPDFRGTSAIAVDFRQVTAAHLRQYCEELSGLVAKGEMSQGTYRLHVQRVKRLFEYLYLYHYINYDPGMCLPVIKGREYAPWRMIQPAEVEKMLKAVVLHSDYPLRDLAVFAILCGMGLRPCEVVNLTIGDIDTQAALLTVVGKNKKARRLPIPGPVLLILQRYLQSRPSSLSLEAPLWDARYGRPFNYERLRELFHKYERLAGIQPKKGRGPHAFRHYFITVNLLNGADPEDIAALAGHSNLRALSSYFHTTIEGLRAALLRAYGLLEGSA